MMKSLYSGVSGLKTHNQRMDVIGNNIANVNTTGFKASAVTFKDVYYQTKSAASAGDSTKGATNPKQVGYGSSVGTVNQVMTQSGLNYSDSVYDCAIQGEGFFQVMDEAGNIFYTRSGVFTVDNNDNLVDSNGYIVLGTAGDSTGTQASSQRLQLHVPGVDNNVASMSKMINGHEITVSANGYGVEGNITLTLQDGEVPFAQMSGSNLVVTLDLDQSFATADAFEDAVNAAILAGGVDISDDVLPINIDFDSIPTDTNATNASNIMSIVSGTDKINLKFTSQLAGEFANAYEVNLKTSSTATAVTAKWNNDTLTITVPGNDEDGNPADIGVDEIQAAINIAAGMTLNGITWEGGTERKIINVLSVDDDGEEITGDNFSSFDFEAGLGANVLKTGLANGTDNFYGSIAKLLNTIQLSDGRFESDQSVADLESVYIDDGGCIWGVHAVHGIIQLGRIDLVTFENPTGLEQSGTSYWTQSLASGEPQVKVPGEEGAGAIVSGALEMSNVDLSQEFSDMIITQRGFQANSRVITTSDTMLEELINLKR